MRYRGYKGKTGKKVRFLELANRVTGFSTPIFGVSWNPPTLEVEIATRLLTYLEDRRVLYTPYSDESLRNVSESIIQIRERLTKDLEQLDRSSDLAKSLFDMRAACRNFLNKVQRIEAGRVVVSIYHRNAGEGAAYFFAALGELRAVFGIHIAQIAVKYGIDIEESLASILPMDSSEERE